jgi:prepilin-type N-terminal cleavage/methylation domain-containing protein
MKDAKGFSLVELLIVVAIIAIIAAIAVPSLLTSRQASNEAAAIQGCRTLGSAEIAFSATNNQNYALLSELVAGNFLDSRFSNPTSAINGYSYAEGIAVTGAPQAGAAPTSFGFVNTPVTGLGRYLYGIGPDQVVRYEGPEGSNPGMTNYAAGDPIGQKK